MSASTASITPKRIPMSRVPAATGSDRARRILDDQVELVVRPMAARAGGAAATANDPAAARKFRRV